MSIRLFKKKEIIVPTTWGCLFFVGCFTIFFVGIVYFAHQFLAQHKPVNAKILVVEAWIPEYAMEQVAYTFNTYNYDTLITVGGDLPKGALMENFQNYAHYAAFVLQKFGVDSTCIVKLPVSHVKKDRTYHLAKATYFWFQSNSQTTKFDVITMASHARRSRLLFELVFGSDYNIGVIPMDANDYDKATWWKSSAGVRTVIGDAIAYIYAKFLFFPDHDAKK